MSKSTSLTIRLSATSTPGDVHAGNVSQKSADLTSKLLMENHNKYHVLFNEAGLHNHLVHHLLSIYSLGANAQQIQAAYDLNKNYQRSTGVQFQTTGHKLLDAETFKMHLGDSKYYQNYLEFFQNEIALNGVEKVLNEYLFKGDDKADDLLIRMYSGFLHPILHLGFGLEYHQPCIVAESLASACIHDTWPCLALLPAERLSRTESTSSSTTLLSLAEELRLDPVVSIAVQHHDAPNKIVSGLYKRAKRDTINIVYKYVVPPFSTSGEDLSRKTAEMICFCIYLAAACQNPKKQEMIDFFLMHSVNLSIFFITFLKQNWIAKDVKCRLLEWKGRKDLIMYAACRRPALYPERIEKYSPKRSSPADNTWDAVFARACAYQDDGHTSKLIRAIRNGWETSSPYFGTSGFSLKRDDFLKIAHMVMDSVERMDDSSYRMSSKTENSYARAGLDEQVIRIVMRWVRWCGLDEAWIDVPDLEEGKTAGAKL